MPSKAEVRNSILVIPSSVQTSDDKEGGEETEITAQVSLPSDGAWGWVVVFASFTSYGLLDGVIYTFGTIIVDMSIDMKSEEAPIALVNSVAACLYQALSPIASAFVNRFGFRACIMTGAVITSFSLFISYFAPNYITLLIFYGVFTGFGCSLVNMCCALGVGFYFEKYRSIALSICACGSSLGVSAFYPLNSFLVSLAGWRTTTLLHSGLIGLIFFLGMTFRPLVSLTVARTTETNTDGTRTVTYLPSLAAVASHDTQTSKTKVETMKPGATERMFSAVSSAHFPTAAAVVEEEKAGPSHPSTSMKPGTSGVSKLSLVTQEGELTDKQLKIVKSIMSTSKSDHRNIEVLKPTEPVKKRGCWGRLFHWQSHTSESRPMYRDDAFYGGKLENLPVYQKSKMDARNAPETETGLEYQLAVSRAVAVADLRERRGVFTTAVRRVLATMLDPNLLKRCSFILLCISGALMWLGFLVPFVYLQARNEQAGIDSTYSSIMISVIGACNTAGRIVLGIIGNKLDPSKTYCFCFLLTGVSTIVSNFWYNLYFQFAYSFIFGFCIASLSSLRSIVLVKLYGLDKLTNATGIILCIQGLASLFSTPLASTLKDKFGYAVAFYVAGGFMTLSGLIIIPLNCIVRREAATQADNPPESKKSVTIQMDR